MLAEGSVMGATLATKTSTAERVAAGTDLNAIRIVPYANPFRTYPLSHDYEKFKKLVEEKNVACYIVNTGDFMGKKVQKEDTLGLLESIVENRAEFKQWGPFEDIEICEWEGFVPDLSDKSYIEALTNAMKSRVKAVEGFRDDNEGYDALPDEALEALNKDPDAEPTQLLQNVRCAVDAFVKGAEQFDDLTMLCMEYRGSDPNEHEEV